MREDNTSVLAALAVLLLAAASAYVLRARVAHKSSHMHLPQPIPQNSLHPQHDLPDPPDTSKQSRSKERRRRGKDPFKDILKGGKKASKLIAKLERASVPDRDPNGAFNSTPSPPNVRSPSPDPTPTPMPSSDSESKQPDSPAHPAVTASPQPYDHRNDDDLPSALGSQPSYSSASESLSAALVPLLTFETNDTPAITASTSMPPYLSSSPPAKPSTDARRPPSQKYNSTWDNHGPSAHETTYQKPPRFQSQSRVSSSGSITGPMAYSMSFPQIPVARLASPPAQPLLASSSSSSGAIHDPSRSFTFPSLNSPSPLPTESPSAPFVNGYANSSSSAEASPDGSQPEALVGSSSTPPELNSIKAALVASRMREEKYKQEAEHYSKECETLRWRWAEDTAVLRRREAELQHQVTVLMHQLQAYAAAYMSHPYTPTSSSSRRQGPGYVPHAFGSASPHPLSPSTPMHHPSSGPTSPVQQQTRTPSPFVAFAPSQSPTQPPTPQQSKLLSLLFPAAGNNGSSPTMGPGMGVMSLPTTSSPRSPQLLDASSPLRARGRQRTRVSVAQEDGWVVSAYEGDEEEWAMERDGVSELLAGAVLRHPESLRARTPRLGEGSPKTEFTFPSIAAKDDGTSTAEVDDVFRDV